ncbi:uncharacterized protein LOC128986606 [Macrosteles quadrilineatus]|uniref:uncharacterized protein LOC128986606 n=1 Tax=Macrosteles quadrilineatus TaxID=74068 RepID=UPI0023E16FAE|nr:uncharacterized protein LOC128986606 [Macrosteles quadrilineatus]
MNRNASLTVANEASDNGSPILHPVSRTSWTQFDKHKMSSKISLRSVANTSAPVVPLGLRSCGCARRFIPQHSQSAPVLARRRSRSSTGSSSKSVGSGRNTPSPSPMTRSNTRLKQKSRSESHLAGLASPPPPPDHTSSGDILRPCLQPVHFSTTLLIRLGPNRQHYLEQVKYEMKYGPGPYQDEPILNNQQFKTELEVQLENHFPADNTNQT